MLKIDAHQHFWKFHPVKDAWITEDMGVLRQDFLPEHLLPLLRQNGMDGCVAVQADQSEAENDFLLGLAAKHDFIKGVVGWVDLQADNVAERLDYYSQFKKIKGFRHILQDAANRALMLQPGFKRGISLLDKYRFTYDILVYPDQLSFAAELAKLFPNQRFVLDHIGKPYIKDDEITRWAADIKQLAACENVWCKVSGLVTEASWKTWHQDTFIPYLDVIVESFGMDRLMFGSDWPVCKVAADYHQVKAIVDSYLQQFSVNEQQKLFGGNAIEFYTL
ncbi:amidohydrolase family protein [Pedobacter sp. BS3]|uniref:amidohydrolase family protein n=1 Tax=Pedobacter sp. BS3 TaxID=2567937 RepID=UPI0011EBE9D8|nr:amidohydrolase family protein [Pedobacter sp. BS3]TZF84931.1 amidohydrolase family protein [Pedobacter sp. BS3]